jgi:DNA-directed RNA polymerase specialized sigma24 family protein
MRSRVVRPIVEARVEPAGVPPAAVVQERSAVERRRQPDIEVVHRAIEGLPADLKIALLLRDVVGLSYMEIADALEIRLSTVKWRIFKAREGAVLALARADVALGEAKGVEARPRR